MHYPLVLSSHKRIVIAPEGWFAPLGCIEPAQRIKLIGPTLCAALALACSSAAGAADELPSLCRDNEEIILAAKVRRVVHGESRDDAPEKIVSICGTGPKGRLDTLIYRFGSEQNAEIEIRTTPTKRAGFFEESDAAAHAGRIGIRFEKPPYAYEVSEGSGMSPAVNVEVYRNRTPLALFQGCTWLGCPYASELSSLRQVSPQLLLRSKPLKPW